MMSATRVKAAGQENRPHVFERDRVDSRWLLTCEVKVLSSLTGLDFYYRMITQR